MRSLLHHLRKRPLGFASLIFIVFLLLASVVGPLIYAVPPHKTSENILKAPNAAHLLGTDDLGRDILAGLVQGIRVSLSVGFVAAAATTLVGVLLGAFAGYMGKWMDSLIMRIAEFFQVMPTFILAVLIVALVGPGIGTVMLIIALLYWPQTARVARGEVMRVSQLGFVDAARSLDLPQTKILFGEVLPNAVGPALALSTLIVADAILLEAAISFLGLSQPDLMSWGRMLSVGQHYIFVAWWLSVFPGLAIFLTVLSFNLLGDTLGDLLNPRRAK